MLQISVEGEEMRTKRKKWSVFAFTEPLPFLNESNEIIELSKTDLVEKIDLDYIDRYRSAFESRDPIALRSYYVFLKSIYAGYEAWDNGFSQALIAIGSGTFSSLISLGIVQPKQHNLANNFSFGFTIGILIAIVLIFFIPMLLGIARKKAKATLFMTLIEGILSNNRI